MTDLSQDQVFREKTDQKGLILAAKSKFQRTWTTLFNNDKLLRELKTSRALLQTNGAVRDMRIFFSFKDAFILSMHAFNYRNKCLKQYQKVSALFMPNTKNFLNVHSLTLDVLLSRNVVINFIFIKTFHLIYVLHMPTAWNWIDRQLAAHAGGCVTVWFLAFVLLTACPTLYGSLLWWNARCWWKQRCYFSESNLDYWKDAEQAGILCKEFVENLLWRCGVSVVHNQGSGDQRSLFQLIISRSWFHFPAFYLNMWNSATLIFTGTNSQISKTVWETLNMK